MYVDFLFTSTNCRYSGDSVINKKTLKGKYSSIVTILLLHQGKKTFEETFIHVVLPFEKYLLCQGKFTYLPMHESAGHYTKKILKFISSSDCATYKLVVK